MKKIIVSISNIFLIIIFILSGCKNAGNNTTNRTETKWQAVNIKHFRVDSIRSIVNWTREVDNKKIKKKVKLFGNYVDVDMENIKYNADGEFLIKSGEFLNINNQWVGGYLELDFSALKIYSEKDEKFFVTTEYPKSLLEVQSIEADTIQNHYFFNSELTILDSSKSVIIPVEIITDSLERINISGIFNIQTLEWPLKENPEPENVRKDEITISLNLILLLSESDIDSVIIE